MVYLICFDAPLAHAHHYIGYCADENPSRRLEEHRAGRGARILQVLNEKGIGYRLVKYWPGKGRDFERKLKNEAHSKRHCPCCQMEGANKC
jgi:predicted GIY-YIG superfamily endonuclease